MFNERTQAVQDAMREGYEKNKKDEIIELEEKDEADMTETELTHKMVAERTKEEAKAVWKT